VSGSCAQQLTDLRVRDNEKVTRQELMLLIT
jgi:hypothetical protein